MRIPSGDLAPARRRKRYGGSYGRSKRRTGRVMLALVVLVGGGAAAYALQRDDRGAPARVALAPCPSAPAAGPTSRPAQPAQPPPVGTLPQPRQVRLLLLNGTTRNGLGRDIGNQLAARGFVVSGTGNAHALLSGPSQVTYGPGALPAAQVVGRHVVGAALVDAPRTARGSLQLVLGSSFARLRTPAELASLVTRPAPIAARTVGPAPRLSGCRP